MLVVIDWFTLNEVETVVCNGRKFMLEPEWTSGKE